MPQQTTPHPFAEENKLLLHLLLKNLPDKTLTEIKSALLKPLNWDYFIRMASSHRVAPIVFTAMKQHELLETIPETTQQRLRQSYLECMVRSMAYHEELITILERFKNAGVPILILKGAALAEGLYGDSWIRPSNDIDILVHRKAMDSIPRIMAELGYTLTEEYRPLDFYERHHFHFVYLKDNEFMNYVTEIHWDLFPPSLPVHFDMDAIWSNITTLSLNGVEIHTLNWDDYFLYLCTHCVRDGFRGLLYFSDLIRITEKISENDWHSIFLKSRQWNTEGAVAGCTKIMADVFKISTPDALRENMNSREKYFINAIGSERNIVQQFLQSNWTVKALAEFLFLKQDTMKFIGRYLMPTEIDLYKNSYNPPGKTSLANKTILFFKGLKALIHMAWTFVRLVILGSKVFPNPCAGK